MNSTELGRYGEEKAVDFLKNQHCKILDRNFSCKQGEIDIVAQDNKEIVFYEVKTRNSLEYGKPVDAVDNYKQKHIWEAAKYYLYKNNMMNEFVRFDVIEVYLKNDRVFINQIRNMFN